MTDRQTDQIRIRDLRVSSKALEVLQRVYNRNGIWPEVMMRKIYIRLQHE